MAIYTGCSVTVAVPPHYLLANKLIGFLESKLQGCKIEIKESPSEIHPQAVESLVAEGSPMSTSQTGVAWTDASQPMAPMESNAGPFLIRAANEAIDEFSKSRPD
jgi:hypothetical protein